VLAFPLYLLLVCVTGWGFFQPRLAGTVFVGGILAFAAWLLVTNYSLRSKWIRGLDEPALSGEEIKIFQKHALYFIFPYHAQQYASTLSFVAMLSYIWLALLAWNREWVLCGFSALVFFVATSMVPLIHPGNFLRYHRARGKLTDHLSEKLVLLESVESKILEIRRRT
jgi:hypothetical protein